MTTAATVARLATARRLFLDAETARGLGDDPARRQAVITYDTSVEDALKTLADHLGLQVKKNANRAQMCDAVQGVVPAHAFALRLREIRNPAMHAGLTPSPDDTDEAADCAVRVLHEVFAAAGQDFTSFTVTCLLHNPLVREPLEKAEGVLQQPVAALGYAARAFSRLEGLVEEAIFVATELESWWFLTPRWADVRLTSECADAAPRQVERLLRVAASAVLTRNLAGLVRMRLLTSGVRLRQREDGTDEVHVTEGKSVTEADALWAIDFVATTAYQVERSLPELRQPVQAPREPRIEAQCLPVRVTES